MSQHLNDTDFAAVIYDIRERFPVSAVAAAAGVKLERAGREWKACCPFHPDNTPSFTIYADDRRAHCFGCGWDGDVIDFVKEAYKTNKTRAAIHILDGGVLATLENRRAPAKQKADMRPVVQRIVNRSQPIAGTPAEAYLRWRGITVDLPQTLRFGLIDPPKIPGNGILEANGPHPIPALIAIVADTTGQLVAIQRTYLTSQGRKAATSDPKGKVKFSLGNVAGGSIRLGPPSSSILVCEGLEDGLTLSQGLGRSVWVAAGTSMMPAMIFPPAVRSIVIGADGNAPGEAAAQKAAAVYTASGLLVRIMRPTPPFVDFNAELMGVRP